MQSCQFAKSVIERGSGKFSAARPAAVSSVELQYSRSRPCSLCFRNHREMLTMVFSRARLRVRLSWSSQILFRHLLDLRTPLLHQGDVTDTFPSVNFCASCGRFWMYVLPTQGELLFIFPVSVGRHFVFRPTWREKLLLSS